MLDVLYGFVVAAGAVMLMLLSSLGALLVYYLYKWTKED